MHNNLSVTSFRPSIDTQPDCQPQTGVAEYSRRLAVSEPSCYVPKVLILGSMPGLASLAAEQYYAHSRNSFWWILSKMLGIDLSADYVQRISQMHHAGVILWDVLACCERHGSLDSDIVTVSEQANDIAALIQRFSSICAIAFNGKKAQSSFDKHIGRMPFRQLHFVTLPSTSPAYAAMSREDKLMQWRTITPFLKE